MNFQEYQEQYSRICSNLVCGVAARMPQSPPRTMRDSKNEDWCTIHQKVFKEKLGFKTKGYQESTQTIHFPLHKVSCCSPSKFYIWSGKPNFHFDQVFLRPSAQVPRLARVSGWKLATLVSELVYFTYSLDLQPPILKGMDEIIHLLPIVRY